MVDFRNLKFTVADVVKICINFGGLVFMYATFTVKLDTLIEAQKGKKHDDDQLHKEQYTETRSIMLEQVSLGSRLTQVEQKISQLELYKK